MVSQVPSWFRQVAALNRSDVAQITAIRCKKGGLGALEDLNYLQFTLIHLQLAHSTESKALWVKAGEAKARRLAELHEARRG